MKDKIKKGFTLVELLVVMAILSILSTVSVVGYVSFVNKANLETDKQEASDASRALQYYLTEKEIDGEDVDLNTPNDIQKALFEATDGVYDLNTKKLRSAKQGYNIWFDTNENKLVIAKDVDEIDTSNLNGTNDEDYSLARYSNISAFMWTEETPYLLVSNNGTDVSTLIYDLRKSTVEDSFDLAGLKLTDNQLNAINNSLFINNDGFIYDFSNSNEGSKNLLFADDVTNIQEIGDYTLNGFTIPTSVTSLEAGVFYDTKLSEVNINHLVSVNANAFNSNTRIYLGDNITLNNMLNDIFTYSSQEIIVKTKSDTYKYIENTLVNSSNQVYTISKESTGLDDVNRWSNDVDDLKQTLTNGYSNLSEKIVKYDVVKYYDKIINLNFVYNAFKNWQIDYLDSACGDSVISFYNETTDENDHLVLNQDTGIWNRYNIYKDIVNYLQGQLENKEFNFSTEVNYNLVEKDINIHLSSPISINGNTYNVLVTEDTDSVEKIYIDNIFSVNYEGVSSKYESGEITKVNTYGDTTFTFVSRFEQSLTIFTFKVSGEFGTTGINILSKMLNNGQGVVNVSSLPIYGNKNVLTFYITLNGKLESVLNNEDVTVSLISNDSESSIINSYKLVSLNDAEKIKYALEINLNEVTSFSSYYLLSVATGDLEASMYLRLQEGNNISKVDASLYNLSDGNYYLNNSIEFAYQDESIVTLENGIAIYKTNYYSDTVMTLSNANLYGNGYTLDGSKITSVSADNPTRAILSAYGNSKIYNVDFKLGLAETYQTINNPFNQAAAGILANGQLIDGSHVEVINCSFTGGLRGVRILNANNTLITISGSTFRNVMVAMELWAGANSISNAVVNVSNTAVDPLITANTYGFGILFFPGGGGSGMTQFNNISLNLDNYKYYGWFDYLTANEQIKKVLDGILETQSDTIKNILSVLLNFKNELKTLFEEGAGKYVYDEKFSPSIIAPTKIYGKALFSELINHSIDLRDPYIDENSDYVQVSKNKTPNLGAAKTEIRFSIFFTKVTDNVEPDTYNVSNMRAHSYFYEI